MPRTPRLCSWRCRLPVAGDLRSVVGLLQNVADVDGRRDGGQAEFLFIIVLLVHHRFPFG